MTIQQTDEPPLRKPFRLWPGVLAVVLQWLVWLGAPLVASSDVAGYSIVAAGFFGGLAVLVWWAFFSRAPRADRWGAIVLMIVALTAASRLLQESLATAGMGVLFFIYAIPVLCLAFVAWAVAARRLADGPRRATMIATILLACGAWTLIRTSGVTGDGSLQVAWRWTETPEERLLAQAGDELAAPSPTPAVVEPPDQPPPTMALEPAPTPAPPSPPPAAEIRAAWPGFRGPDRNSIVPGVRIETDWSASPPVELWRRPVGPGWSSFAVRGEALYTQENVGNTRAV
jgi:outer membrane protein assembly factor BamB